MPNISNSQTFPPYQAPIPCGGLAGIEAGRGRPSPQLGWYDFVADVGLLKNMWVLDVGAAFGCGAERMEREGAKVTRLENGYDIPNTVVCQDLAQLPDNAWDIVTCIDVLEHVVDDWTFFQHLKRLARRGLYISTPNFTRSRCVNGHHAREYTIAQFVNYFKPDMLWAASPDGWHHRTHVISRRASSVWQNMGAGKGSQTLDLPISEDVRFDKTVDGQEWPHYCGVWLSPTVDPDLKQYLRYSHSPSTSNPRS